MILDKQPGANVKQAVPFFHVSNMDESLRYYADGLGLGSAGNGSMRANSAGAGWRMAVQP
jgi:hypothetical protein